MYVHSLDCRQQIPQNTATCPFYSTAQWMTRTRRKTKRKKRTSRRTARDSIGGWTPCTWLQDQILWLRISHLPWQSLGNASCNSTLSCAFWTLYACPANWWLGQKCPWSPLEKPPARKSALTPARKPSPTARNACTRAGGLTRLSEIHAKGLDSHTPSCRKRGSSNRKAGAWKTHWPAEFPSWIWP